MPRPIRVLVANHPRLMRDAILASLSAQPDIQIVGEAAHEGEIAARVAETRPDFLFIALNESGNHPEICGPLLRGCPAMRIIALAPERRYSMLYWVSVRIEAEKIEPSAPGILNALRGLRRT